MGFLKHKKKKKKKESFIASWTEQIFQQKLPYEKRRDFPNL